MRLQEETHLATRMLKGKVVRRAWRHRLKELGIEFTDGTRLFVDSKKNGLEISITDGELASRGNRHRPR